MAKETKIEIAIHVVVVILMGALFWAMCDTKSAIISMCTYTILALWKAWGKMEVRAEMEKKCLYNFIEGAAKVVTDTDAAMKALGIDEETQQNIRKAREIVHKARCGGFPVPDKINIKKETTPQPPSFEESQGEQGTNVAD